MEPRVRFSWMRTVSIALLTIIQVACGGGGGGGGGDAPFPGFTPVSESTPMTIDEYSAATTAGMVGFAHSLGGLVGPSSDLVPLGQNAASREGRSRQAVFRAVLNQVQAHLNDPGYRAAGTGSVREACPNGGSYSATFQWDGPDEVSSVCDMFNLRGTIQMYNCAMDGESAMDGTISVQYTGDACEPSAMYIALENFSFGVYDTQILSRYLEISASGLLWSNGSVYSATTVMNGQAVGVDGNQEIAAAFYDYTEIAETYLGDDYYYYTRLDIYGGITGPCVDGWAYIETDAAMPIILSDYAICPVDGHMVVSGDYAIDVTYFSDGSVLVGEYLYPSCEDLETACPLP